MEKRKQTAIESGILILVIAGILVAVNALSAFGVYATKDTTKNERYTLSKGSGNLLRSMKNDLVIEAYVTKGLPKLDAFVRDLRDLLQEYKQAGGDKFDFRIIEAKGTDEKKAAEAAGLKPLSFGEPSDTEEKATLASGYMGLVFRYGEQQDVIPVLSPDRDDGLEFWITNKIRDLRDKGDSINHTIGVLTGHDEETLSDPHLEPSGRTTYQAALSENFPFYKFENVDLKGGDSEVPATLDGLFITQPEKDLTEKELRRIDQFVMKGKSLVVFASAVNLPENDPKMTATLNTHGLEKLLDGYGITMNKDALLDFGRAFSVKLMTQAGPIAISRPYPAILDLEQDDRFTGDETLLDTSFAPFFRLSSFPAAFASSLTIHPEKQPDAKIHVRARTTPASKRETSESIELSPSQNWGLRTKGDKSDFAQFVVAADEEGTIKSAFPEGDKQGVDAPEKSAGTARIFVLSSSEVLTNPFVRSGGPPSGPRGPMGRGDENLMKLAGPYLEQEGINVILMLKNTLDWMSDEKDLLAASAKIAADPKLAYGAMPKPNFGDESDEQLARRSEEMRNSRVDEQRRVEWILILGVPLLFVIGGFLRRQIRTSSRANASLA